jgi:hypothetical protein
MQVTVYRCYNTKNGKWYVGSTSRGLEIRKKEHYSCGNNDPFHNSLRKNPNLWEWEVISLGPDRSHEQEILDVYHGSEYCLNISPLAGGGDLGIVHQKKDKKGRSLHALKIGVLGNEVSHRRKTEEGKSLHAVAMGSKGGETTHKERDCEGKSVKAVKMGRRMAEFSHLVKDDWGRSVNAVLGTPSLEYSFLNLEDGEVFGPFPSSHVAGRAMGMTAKKVRYWAKKNQPVDGFLISVKECK